MGNDFEDVRVDQSLNDSEPTCQTQGVNARVDVTLLKAESYYFSIVYAVMYGNTTPL